MTAFLEDLELIQELHGEPVAQSHAWLSLYKLAIHAAEVSLSERFRISEFALILRFHSVQNPGTWAVAYAHCVAALLIQNGAASPAGELPVI